LQCKRTALVFFVAGVLARSASAQQWGVGAAYGWFNDLEHNFRLENFHSPDWEAWVESRLAHEVFVRLTYGDMKIHGDNVGQSVVIGGTVVTIPDYRDHVRYVTIGVSYLFPEGPFTTALVAGLGGYGIRPESISPPELGPFRDNRERVFGLHVGAEGELKIYRGFGVDAKLIYHWIFSETRRSILVAGVGATYRF
jgi:hypothetical protein